MRIESAVSTSRLRNLDPAMKCLFSLVTLILSVLNGSISIAVLILIIMFSITVIINGTGFKTLLKLMTLPLMFLIMGIIPMALDFSGDRSIFIYSLPLGDSYLGLTSHGGLKALNVMVKALSSVSCLYFMVLSTPLMDIVVFMRRVRIPELFTELMGLIYRFIAVLSDAMAEMHRAQDSRLGYRDFKTSYRSLATLISGTLNRSMEKTEDFMRSLESRCSSGTIRVLPREYEKDRRIGIIFLLTDITLTMVILISLMR